MNKQEEEKKRNYIYCNSVQLRENSWQFKWAKQESEIKLNYSHLGEITVR